MSAEPGATPSPRWTGGAWQPCAGDLVTARRRSRVVQPISLIKSAETRTVKIPVLRPLGRSPDFSPAKMQSSLDLQRIQHLVPDSLAVGLSSLDFDMILEDRLPDTHLT